jgi:hypothetical protein
LNIGKGTRELESWTPGSSKLAIPASEPGTVVGLLEHSGEELLERGVPRLFSDRSPGTLRLSRIGRRKAHFLRNPDVTLDRNSFLIGDRAASQLEGQLHLLPSGSSNLSRSGRV